MLFSDTVVVKDRDGYSTEGHPSSERSHPEYKRKMAVIRMSSNDVNATTTYEIAKRDSFKTPEKGDLTYYSSLFEKKQTTTRVITIKIDGDSLSENLRCISNYGSNLLSVRPTGIKVTIWESDNENNNDVFGSQFYFLDKRDKSPSLFRERDDSLSIDINLNKLNFSKIFDDVRSGYNSANIALQFIAYSDGVEWLGKNTYLIDADNESNENFVMLTSVSFSSLPLNKNASNDNNLDDYEEINLEAPQEDKKEAMLNEILSSLDSLSYTAKNGFYALCVFVMLFMFFTFK